MSWAQAAILVLQLVLLVVLLHPRLLTSAQEAQILQLIAEKADADRRRDDEDRLRELLGSVGVYWNPKLEPVPPYKALDLALRELAREEGGVA
ncbi:hypothetical protein [Phenylobacterium sp.]|uniref:hypothetical protein n=1 Tax=Phenylobacterium sp. TaxID=1871053 RepID=UPI00301D5587